MGYFVTLGNVYYEGTRQDATDVEVSARPGLDYDWIDGEWIRPAVPYSLERLDAYRTQRTEIEVTYSGVTVMNDDLTRQRILQKMNSMLLGNPSGTVEWETVNGFENLTLEKLQGLYLACDTWQEKCFSASRVVRDNNDSTPYTSWDAAENDFDEAMED